jgi:Glycosyltransferase family 87
MGPVSLLLRAPFVALVYDQSLTLVYFAGALPCVAAVVAVIIAVRRRMVALGRPQAALALVLVAGLLNTGLFRALHWGHPEELLGAALCVGAVLAALRDRTVLAAILLGLAIATKQWAFVAGIPVLLAASRRQWLIVLVTGVVVGALTVPGMVMAPAAFVEVHEQAVAAPGATGPASVWWLVSSDRTAAERASSLPGFAYEIPAGLAALTHPLIVLVTIPLGLLFWLRRGRSGRGDALGLLALVLLLRCILDPWNNDYYHAPFLLALLAWEAVERSGWPRMTLFAAAALAVTFPAGALTFTQLSAAGDALAIGYMAWSLPLAGWIALSVYAPARADALAAALRARLTVGRGRDANVARA